MAGAEWSVLIKAKGPPRSRPIERAESDRLLAMLPGIDKWVQYPPASGRGHAFEARFWVSGADAATAGDDAGDLFASVLETIGLGEWTIVRIHVASVAERALEMCRGLERRLARGASGEANEWSVMLRAIPGQGEPELGPDRLNALSAELPGDDADVAGRHALVEVRFWLPADDSVEATLAGADILLGALARLDRPGWRVVRAHTASVAERAREMYLGAERRLRATAHQAGP